MHSNRKIILLAIKFITSKNISSFPKLNSKSIIIAMKIFFCIKLNLLMLNFNMRYIYLTCIYKQCFPIFTCNNFSTIHFIPSYHSYFHKKILGHSKTLSLLYSPNYYQLSQSDCTINVITLYSTNYVPEMISH